MNTKLKELREQNNLSQTQTAKIADISQSNYSKTEKEDIKPNIDMLIKLADYYNVTLDYLIGRNFTNDIGYLTHAEKEFVQTYLQLNEENKIYIAGVALGLIARQKDE